MKILFAGTPDFSVHTLSALIDSKHEIVGVLTQPDKPKGRGRKTAITPVKQLAKDYDLPILQPTTLKNDEIQADINRFRADIMVVIAYGLMLPTKVLDLFPHGCVNIHASLLPKYRGASPIQAAILNGDNETGVTIMAMNEGMDTGDMLLKATCKLNDDETSQTLHDKLAVIGADALIQTLDMMEKGSVTSTKQDDSQASYVKKIKKTDAEIDWQQSADSIYREIRAYYGWPVAYTTLEGEPLRVWEASVSDYHGAALPGEIIGIQPNEINIACGTNSLSILSLQLPGGKRLKAKDCLNSKSHLFQAGKTLGQ